MKITSGWRIGALLLLLLALSAACRQENPILGRWRADPENSPPGSIVGLEMSGSRDLEFLETRVIAGSSSLDVTYTVESDRVTVTSIQGHGTVYEIQSEDRMSVETPMGPIVFRRLE